VAWRCLARAAKLPKAAFSARLLPGALLARRSPRPALTTAPARSPERPMAPSIRIETTKTPRSRPGESDLGFGKHFTDHVFFMDWVRGQGWHDPRILPYGPLALDPAAASLHYGQEMFEGMKAFRGADGVVRLFRLDAHVARMGRGAPRLCMPAPDPELMAQGIRELVRIDADWVPSQPGTALYIRPTMIASEAFLGVRPSNRYLFFTILCPVGSYYGGGMRAVKIWIERGQTRAAPGGLGAVKAAANYAASLEAAVAAKERGYDQVLWLDATTHSTLEEVGTMNLFVRIGDELATAPLGDTILAGITRDCVLTLAKDLGIVVRERPITVTELLDASEKGTLKEVFGTGTAAVVSTIGELAFDGATIPINGGRIGEVAKTLYDAITGIQAGTSPDKHGWLQPV
jgi:branched-chain amino acid aminotransferase